MTENKRYLGKQIDASMLPKTEDGSTCCRWCGKGVKPPRRTLCSPECVHELKLRISGRYLRDCVYMRDKGICNICNVDTKNIASVAKSLCGVELTSFLLSHNISLKRKIWRAKYGGGLWDADHITPVKKGGGMCGLENIRTLCIACHKLITKTSAEKPKIKKIKKEKIIETTDSKETTDSIKPKKIKKEKKEKKIIDTNDSNNSIKSNEAEKINKDLNDSNDSNDSNEST
jgi:5-methylcytosine-specific restriction protein A